MFPSVQFQSLRNKCLSFDLNNENRDAALDFLTLMETESTEDQSEVIRLAGCFHDRYFFTCSEISRKFGINYRDITQPYLLGLTQVSFFLHLFLYPLLLLRFLLLFYRCCVASGSSTSVWFL